MAKAGQEEIEAVSPCVHSGEDGAESGLCREGDGLGSCGNGDGLEGSRTCCRTEHCRNGPTDRAHREMGSREFSKSHQNSHGMDCDGSCQLKPEPILNNDVEFLLATKLKEKLILNGINLSPPPPQQQGSSLHSGCTESVHIDNSENAHRSASAPTHTNVHECDRNRETDQATEENESRQVLNCQQTEPTFEYELPENLTEPFSVAKLIPATDEDIDVIPGDVGEMPVKLIAYESERQIQSIMTLITKDLSEPYSIYTYRYFIHNWPNLCFLAMHEAACVGAIVCKLDNHKKLARRGYIAMLAVDQEYRKRKIGSNLVRKAIRTMIRDDCDEVVLETEITNKPALRLYENLGFVRDKRLFRYYLNGVDALRLKLWLR